MKLKRITALLLAALMVLGVTGCASANVKTIATVEGQAVPSGVYLAYMLSAYNEASAKVPDRTKDILKQQVEEMPASDWITKRAEELLREHVAVNRQFAEQGLTMDEAATAALDAQAQYAWELYKELYEKNGVSYNSYRELMSYSFQRDALFQAQYGENGKTPVAQDELQAAFQSGYFRARYITASLTDQYGLPMEDADKQQALDMLNTVLTNAQSGDFATAILTSEKEQALKDGREESTIHTHDETSHVYYMDKKNYTEDFVQQVEAMATGELKLITTDTTAYLVEKLEIVPEDLKDYRNTLLYSLKDDAFQTEVTGWANALNLEFVQESKNLYKPSKLKLA